MNKAVLDRLYAKLIDDMADFDVDPEEKKKPVVEVLDHEPGESDEETIDDESLQDLGDELADHADSDELADGEWTDDEVEPEEEMVPEDDDEPLALKKRFAKITR